MNASRNLRRHPRRSTYLVARYRIGEGTYRDIIRDIGAGGLFVWTTRGIAVGQPITLEFPLFDLERTVKIAGRVARRGPSGFAVAFNVPIPALVDRADRLARIVHESQRLSGFQSD